MVATDRIHVNRRRRALVNLTVAALLRLISSQTANGGLPASAAEANFPPASANRSDAPSESVMSREAGKTGPFLPFRPELETSAALITK